jgi:hypothetical protein
MPPPLRTSNEPFAHDPKADVHASRNTSTITQFLSGNNIPEQKLLVSQTRGVHMRNFEVTSYASFPRTMKLQHISQPVYMHVYELQFCTSVGEEEDKVPKPEEVKAADKTLKSSRTTGLDNTNAGLMKLYSPELTNTFNA